MTNFSFYFTLAKLNQILPGGGGWLVAAVVTAAVAAVAAAVASVIAAVSRSAEREAVVSSGPLIPPIYCNNEKINSTFCYAYLFTWMLNISNYLKISRSLDLYFPWNP